MLCIFDLIGMSTQILPRRPHILLLFAVLLLNASLNSWVGAQAPAESGPLDGVLLGKWTYRSFQNNPAQGTSVQDLLFGEGVMSITSARDGAVSGTFDFGPGYQMTFKGTVTYGNPATLQFQGKGTGESNGDWLYDYTGHLGFQFPQGVDQTPSLVGTVVRAQPHSGGKAPAGVTASWIAVKEGAASDGGGAAVAAGVARLMTEGVAPLKAKAAAMAPKTNFSKLRQKYGEDEASKLAHPDRIPAPKVLKATGKKLKAVLESVPLPLPAPTSKQPSLQPVTVTSKGKRLELDLVVDYNKTELKIGNDPVHLRTYNGQLVGPVMRAKAGDTLSITVHNNLPDVPPPTPGFMNGHHDWNVTNLHFHGLHVAPQGTPDAESDNVLLEIMPNTSQHYEVHIPPDHPAGTFWYHAHRHGSTAAQVSSGMAGALIIDREDDATNLDAIPEVAAAAQEVMVLQAIAYQKAAGTPGQIELYKTATGTSADDMFSPGDWFKMKRYITVNGLKIPTITIAPGEVRRLRLIAAGQRETMQLCIGRDADGKMNGEAPIPFNEIAQDGLVTGMRAERNVLELFPGYRSDVLIQPSKMAKGTYYIVDMNTVKNAPGATGADGSPERTSIIAQIVIAGAPVEMKLPEPEVLVKQRLPDLKDKPGQTTRYAFYGLDFPADGSVKFYVSEDDIPSDQVPPGVEFDPEHQARYLPLGRQEKWLVGSRNGPLSPGQAPLSVTHPFHIHVNPFLVTGIVDDQGKDALVTELGGSVWRDTLAMKQGYTYTLLTEYTEFTGSFVDHCHILDHEDHGMMEKVTIYDPATPPQSAPLGAVNEAPAQAAGQALLQPVAGKPLLAVVVRSVDCGLCQDQIKAFEKAAQAADWPKDLQLVFVAPDPVERVKAPAVQALVKKGRLIADPQGTVLRSIDPAAKAENRGHGILLLDGNGSTIFKSAGTEPLLEPQALQPHMATLESTTSAAVAPGAAAGPRVSIAVWNTPAANDDYVTWAPTPCTIRLSQPEAQDLEVTLTNDPEGPIPSGRTTPLDGDVAFAAQLAQGQTAKAATLTLRLPKDGSPVSFFIAGKFPRASTKDKDCVIEIHEAAATGALIGSQALMVRVRKDHRALTTYERQRFLEALDYLQRTAVAPEGGSMYMHYVRMHKAAAFGLEFDPSQPEPQYAWPDLAHKGPGFISWHRAFLLAFERTLQETYPDVALPYWIMSDPSELFTVDFLGANPVNGKGSTTALFSSSNPLYGWTADIDGVVNQLLLRRGYGRNPGDAKFGPFFADSDLFKLDHFSYFPLQVNLANINDPVNSFASMVEMNPHNSGHNWVGPWMANCETSPRDPIFWVFHTGFDRQWAKWQLTKNRFAPDGSSDSFCPKGTFDNPGPLCDPEQPPPPKDCNDLAPNACVPVNHHLADPLWPWNQKSGKASTVNGSYPEATMAAPFLKPFPAAPIPGLFPASPLAITNGDTIDFMGKTPGRLAMGFCYDDTPYDNADLVSTPPHLFAALEAVQVPGQLNVQKTASLIFGATKPERDKAVTSLRKLQENAGGDVTSRRGALRILTQRGDTELPFQIARSADPKHAALKPEALRLLSEFMMFTSAGQKRKKEVMDVMEKTLESPDQETRSEALWALAGPQAPKELIEMLSDAISGKPDAKFSVEEAIQALATSGKAGQAAKLIRPLLKSKNPAVQAAAIGALANDKASSAARSALVRDATAPQAVRSAALQSLNPADAAEFSLVLSLATDAKQNAALRGEAAALLGVWARSSQVPLSPSQLASVRDGLTAITDAGSLGIEAAVARALRSVHERLAPSK